MKTRHIGLALLMVALAGSASGLELNRVFSDNMVLQRDKPLVIRGTAVKGADVTVEFAGQKKSAKADGNGAWSVTLDPVAASAKPAKLTAISSIGNQKSEIGNILVGDVFLHARQTNIDISLGRDEEGRKAAAAIKPNPMFRVISLKMIPSVEPLSDLAAGAAGGWAVVDRDTALKMTASAYYLGRDLAASAQVPIGIMDLNMGPAFANSWLSREALLETDALYGKTGVPGKIAEFDALLKAEREGVPLRSGQPVPVNTIHHPLFTAGGYNGTLRPLAGLALKAVLIQLGNDYPYMRYQEILDSDNPSDPGVLDVAYRHVYLLRKEGFRMESVTVPRIPREWRKALGDEALPFGLMVPPGSDLNTLGQHHREMRELQRLTAAENPGVGIILPGTTHIPFSAQPADEGLLAARCLAWLEGSVYKKPDAPATGPLFDRIEASYNEATIYFKDGTAKGLKAGGSALAFFEVANVEGDYYPAIAKIDGDTIHIESDNVDRIVRIRYNWNQKPNQELVNAAVLPAIPFRTERAEYDWFVRNEENDWAEEYFKPANEWGKNDVTLINVALQRAGFGNFSGWIGPAGFKAGPFGPNMGVGEIKKGSPADGKLLAGDVIYSANGKMLGKESWLVMADAITESETRQGRGRLVLGVRRGAENIDVELSLPVMGTYSSTSPYDCPKTEKIVDNLAKWVTSGKSAQSRRPDFLGTDTLFLLATGDPEVLGLVRRVIYAKMANTKIPDKIEPASGGGKGNWSDAWDAMVMGEYHMATGDRNVLPYIKFYCDRLAATQHPKGAWRHGYGGADHYGLMPALGLAAAIGFNLANDAGLDISQDAYRKVIQYHHDGSGEMGRIVYGVGAGSIPGPREFEPEAVENGKMGTGNGALAAAAVLFDLEGKDRAAHLCSFISAHAWNNTFEGHGGNFFNNFWTPLGAKVQGKKTFINFWKNYRWYRELGRNFDGSFNFDAFKDQAGFGIPLLIPRERLQIVGAPPSPFATNAPAMLKPALDAYWKKDYAGCEKLVNELISSGSVSLNDMPTVEYLARAAKEMQQSIEADLARMQKLVDAGDLWQAKTFLAGLQGVLPVGDERVTALEAKLADVKAPPMAKAATTEPAEKPRLWECLVMDNQVKDPKKIQMGVNKVPILTSKLEKASTWKLNVIEDMNQAPADWFKPKFDDSQWLETTLPTSWRMYHTALLRTNFKVDDKDRFDGLRLRSWIMRQQNVQIYLNGELIAKINGAVDAGDIEQEFKAAALKHLKNGENKLAITTRHNWRWGAGGLVVYNGGFDFNLDARLKE